jgi:LuxR family maltose regulon positive regulatory protein
MCGFEELSRGELAFFRMEMSKAESLLREALLKAREYRQYEIEVRCWFYLMRIGLFLGSADLVRESRQGIMQIRDTEDYINRYACYDIYSGWFYAQIGECDKVSSWLKSEENAPNSLIRGQELLIKARCFLREKKYGAALSALKQTLRNAHQFIMGRVEIKVLEAVCLYQMKRKNEAYAVLEEARILAARGGLFLPFAELGKDMRTLACQAEKDKAAVPGEFLEKIRNLSSLYAKKLLLGSEEFSSRLPAASCVLSRKERDVLNALFQGLTQEEIAESSGRSANTIKSAIKRIYEKLGAVNRADAIRVALNRGILGREGMSAPGTAKDEKRRTSLSRRDPAGAKTVRPLLRKGN